MKNTLSVLFLIAAANSLSGCATMDQTKTLSTNANTAEELYYHVDDNGQTISAPANMVREELKKEFEFILTANSSFIQPTTITGEPIGHHTMCTRIGETFCQSTSAQAVEYFPLSLEDYKTIKNENERTNSMIVQIADIGDDEYWKTPYETLQARQGDCEDIAMLKRSQLHQNVGIPFSAMPLLIVKDENNEGHAVLAVNVFVDNKKLTLILDSKPDGINQADDVTFFHAKPYTLHSIQSSYDMRSWYQANTIQNPPHDDMKTIENIITAELKNAL